MGISQYSSCSILCGFEKTRQFSHRRIGRGGGVEGGRGGTARPSNFFKVGKLSTNPCVIRAKHITLIKVDKKNRGLQ